MARRSPATLLRLRNKELRRARERIERLSAAPHFTLSFLQKAVEAASKAGRVGDLVRVPRPYTIRPGRFISADDIIYQDIHVLRDV